MKTSRVITLVLVAVTTLLCCLPASALDVANSYSYSNVIDNSLTQYLNVSVMYADDESYSYGTDSDVVQYYDAPTYQALVNYRVKNTSDQDANLNVSYIALDFGLQASGYNVIGVEYVSGALEPYYVSISDFRLQQVDGTSTTVIVPAGGYISGTFIIHLQETYDNSSGTHIQYPAFSNFNTWDSFSPTYGNYNSTVIDYVSDVYAELLEQGLSLDDILTYLSTNPSVTQYSNPSITISGNRYVSSYRSSTGNKVMQNVYYFIGDPIPVSSAIDSTLEQYNYSNIYCVPLYFTYRGVNLTDENLTSSNYILQHYFNFRFTSNYTYLGTDLHDLQGDFGLHSFSISPSSQSYVWLYPMKTSGHETVSFDALDTQSCYGCFYYYFGSNDSSNAAFNINVTQFTLSSGNATTNLVFSTVTTDVEDIVEEQHEQEAQYYSDTNTALENSGLPDYNFNSQQTGGLSGVSDDFVRVWNACGALNSVFVFSLTLSLALYILRHRRRL